MNRRIASNDIEFIICELKARLLKGKIIKCHESSSDPEINQVVDFLKKNTITVFPYSFTEEYKISDYPVELDEINKLFYYIPDPSDKGKKIYLRRGYKSKFRASRYMKNLYMEQDVRSPHRYTDDSFDVDENSILIDIGGAEGIFSFHNIERIKHAYIFECDPRWIEALKVTFKDNLDKITIIDKFVTNYCDETHITIDKFIEDYNIGDDPIFIKADAEGDELNIVEGAAKLISRHNNIKLALCTYHLHDHEQKLRDRFNGWNVSTTSGYMIYYYDFDIKAPYLRRGVARISS